MSFRKLPLALAALAAGNLLAFAAHAGVFSVSPVRIYMAPRDRAVAVTVVNEGDTELVIQADINTWSQKPDGTDELVLTEDLVLAPPILKLAPRARQVVRLALLKPADAANQTTYRLILREVPEAAPPKEGVRVPIALALSMPVFITPPGAKPDVNCQFKRVDAKSMDAICANTGNAYTQIRTVTLSRAGAPVAKFEGGQYVLPGARQTIRISAPDAIPQGTAQAQVEFDSGKPLAIEVSLP
jgi:fimbrial chaperone protein